MKHRKKNRTLGRKTSSRKQLIRGLSEALLTHGEITTTKAKAKELQKYIEPLISGAKKKSLANRRKQISKLGKDEMVLEQLMEAAKKNKSRPGGYTRITKLNATRSDGAEVVKIELIK
jgi:large subunit ribosomal protein L17